jgi:hypothetical protein
LQRSIQRELNNFFGKISGSDYSIQVVTKSPFTQARSKLKYDGFIELSTSSIALFYADAPYFVWDKHRVLACDGSTLQLPNSKSIESEFGATEFGHKADAKRSLARIPHFCHKKYKFANECKQSRNPARFNQWRKCKSRPVQNSRVRDLCNIKWRNILCYPDENNS